MKYYLLLSLMFITFKANCQGFGDTIISNNPSNLKAQVLYFHITNRCNTCYSIETNLRKTVFDNFKTEIDSGILAISILNCELPQHSELVKKYEAYGATLAITSYQDGKEIKTEDLTGWAFQKVHKPELFISELKNKLEKSIK